MTPEIEIIGAKEAARLLGMDYKSVLRGLARGDLPGVRVGRVWRISKAALLSRLGLEPNESAGIASASRKSA